MLDLHTLPGGDPSIPVLPPGSLESALLARGIRVTGQRRIILEAVEVAPHCRDAALLHRHVSRRHPRIHRATVYRTLSLLRRQGLLHDRGISLPCAGRRACQASEEPNEVRMRCLRCGKCLSFPCCLLAGVTQCIERDCRFRVASAALEIAGFCSDCRV